MSIVERIRAEGPRELRARIVNGHPVDPARLEGWAYRGTSLGLPRLLERLTWKTFQKTFHRDPVSGALVGWNVRLEQDGLDAPSRPKRVGGAPRCVWHYRVRSPEGAPPGFDRGLLIDYGLGDNAALDTIRLGKDPLVAVEAGSAELLLGVTYLSLGGLSLETPTYFLLEREHPIDYVPPPRVLTALERRWAELLFDAILGAGDGVPSMAQLDRASFWRSLREAPPYFAPGFRAMIHALSLWPLGMRGFRRPMFALDREARLACVARMDAEGSVAVRQMLSTMKVLACFALFEDGQIRRSVGGVGP